MADGTEYYNNKETVLKIPEAGAVSHDSKQEQNVDLTCSTLDSLLLRLGSLSWIERKNASNELARRGDCAVPTLLGVLDSENDDVLYWGIHSLGKIGTETALQPLLKLLENPETEPAVVSYIASALGESANPDILDILINLLSNESWTVCNAAMESLVKKGANTLEPLVEALKTASYNQAFWITKTLSRLGEPGVRQLIKFLGFKNVNVRLLVTESLGESDHPLAVEALLASLAVDSWVVRQSVIEALVKLDYLAVEPMLRRLKDADISYYRAAVEVMEQLGERAVSQLIELLNSESRQMRRISAEFLGRTGSIRAVRPLISCLNDPVWLVRKSAAKGLQLIGVKAINPLMEALESEDENVKYWITTVLGRIGDQTVEPLMSLLRTGNKEMRFFAAQALGQSRDTRAITPLVHALQDKSWPVRKSVSQALKLFGADAIIPVLKSLLSASEDLRFWARKVIEDIGPPEMPLFIRLLSEDPDPEMRYFAAYGLSIIGDERCIDALKHALQRDPNEWVRKYCASALARIGMPETVSVLIDCFNDDNEEVAYWIAKSVGLMGSVAVPALQETLRSSSEKNRFLSIIALGVIGDEGSIKSLINLMSESGLIAEKVQKALITSGSKAIPFLIEALGSENLNIRSGASAVLIKNGDAAVEPLLKAVNSGDKEVHYWATKALREIKKNKERIH